MRYQFLIWRMLTLSTRLIPRSRVLLEKITDSQIVTKFHTFNKPEGSLPHSQVPYPEPDRSSPYPYILLPEDPPSKYTPIYAWVFQVVSFPQVCPPKPCIHVSSPPIHATCPANLILLDLITRTILGEEYRSVSSSLCSYLHSPVTSSLLGPYILLSALFSNTVYVPPSIWATKFHIHTK